MTHWIVEGELTDALVIGALADRALLVIARYLRDGRLPPEGETVLGRIRNFLQESQQGAHARSQGTIGAASIEALAASTQVRSALERGRHPEVGVRHSDDVDRFLQTLDQLTTGGSPDLEAVHALRDFLADVGKQTLDRGTQILTSLGGGPWTERM